MNFKSGDVFYFDPEYVGERKNKNYDLIYITRVSYGFPLETIILKTVALEISPRKIIEVELSMAIEHHTLDRIKDVNEIEEEQKKRFIEAVLKSRLLREV